MFFESPATQFSLMISEATDIPSGAVSNALAHMGSVRCQMHASPVEAVSLMISEATGAVCAVESMGHEWKQFR